MNLSVVAKESMSFHIHPNVVKTDSTIGAGCLRRLEYAAEPGNECAGDEWLQKIIRRIPTAYLEPLDIFSGRNQHEDRDVSGSDIAEELLSGERGALAEGRVKCDEIGPALFGQAGNGVAILGAVTDKVVKLKDVLEETDEALIAG
ncbi:MAG TPA: hypothetical protein VNZ53_42225 [Steroidobacteraceae bacterium]|nr:hypothetical protein [Steroidobacteraceae bacterium]